MLILFMVFPCTTFKYTITAIAITTLQSYRLIKYIKRTIVNQPTKQNFLLQINTITGLFPNFLAKRKKNLDILKYWHCYCGSFCFSLQKLVKYVHNYIRTDGVLLKTCTWAGLLGESYKKMRLATSLV